jgi:hypothetical protein
LDCAGRLNHQSEAPLFIGRGLRRQPQRPDVESRADRARGEFPAGGIQNLGLHSFVIIREFQTYIWRLRIDPDIEKKLRTNQICIFRHQAQSQFVHHLAGDLSRGQYLDLRLDGIHEQADTAQPPRLHGELTGDLEGIVDLNRARGFEDRALL